MYCFMKTQYLTCVYVLSLNLCLWVVLVVSGLVDNVNFFYASSMDISFWGTFLGGSLSNALGKITFSIFLEMESHIIRVLFFFLGCSYTQIHIFVYP